MPETDIYPHRYCVRPNSGRIEPGQHVEVQVLLQAMKEDPPPDARCRDKFLVQSVAISAASDVSNVAQVWANIEQTAKSSIQEKKIRVSFLPADGSDAATNGISHSIHEEEHPPAYSSPAPTPQRSSVLTPSDSSKSPETPTAAQSTLNTATAAVSSVTGYSEEDLKRQLEDAKATISRLQQQATDGLRQRKTGGAGASVEKTNPAGQQTVTPPSGVSVQIVALLCFISFLLAYIFF